MKKYSVNRIGVVLRKLRIIENMTLKSLSEETGLCIGHICDIEHGRTIPSIRSLLNLADFFEVSPEYFMEELL